MDGIHWWDIGLLVIAGYWGATALLRLMLVHRDAQISDVRRQFEEYQRQKKASRKSSEASSGDPRSGARSRPAA